jgi:hypothetical protein
MEGKKMDKKITREELQKMLLDLEQQEAQEKQLKISALRKQQQSLYDGFLTSENGKAFLNLGDQIATLAPKKFHSSGKTDKRIVGDRIEVYHSECNTWVGTYITLGWQARLRHELIQAGQKTSLNRLEQNARNLLIESGMLPK